MSNFCRHCRTQLSHQVIDLGHQPPSNAYLLESDLSKPEITYPLKVFLCTKCWLVQIPSHASAKELFNKDYPYFSSTSSSWCKHAKDYVDNSINRLGLNKKSFVIEIASNDGYLLKNFQSKNIPCLGIEPTHSTAIKSIEKGINTIEEFFSSKIANTLEKADLIIANNVLAHVPDINDFIYGISILLKTNGVVSFEFPHLLSLLKGNQFDTIYHEHFSYFSLNTLRRISESFGLYIFDVDMLNTHGGSLRVWMSHTKLNKNNKRVNLVLEDEIKNKLENIRTYDQFQNSAIKIKNNLLSFICEKISKGSRIYAYGAAAKGNTLLNFAGIKSDMIPAIADKSSSKQGKYTPGSHIPIITPDELKSINPDHIIVLPWNLINEISKELSANKLLTAIPEIRYWN